MPLVHKRVRVSGRRAGDAVSRCRANGSGRFAGVWPIATTPFGEDGRLDLPSLTRVVEHILAGRRARSRLSRDRQRVSDARRPRNGARRSSTSSRVTAGRRPVIVGISSMMRQHVARRACRARRAAEGCRGDADAGARQTDRASPRSLRCSSRSPVRATCRSSCRTLRRRSAPLCPSTRSRRSSPRFPRSATSRKRPSPAASGSRASSERRRSRRRVRRRRRALRARRAWRAAQSAACRPANSPRMHVKLYERFAAGRPRRSAAPVQRASPASQLRERLPHAGDKVHSPSAWA